MRIPKEIVSLIKLSGFLEKYYELCRACDSNKEAYHKTELLYSEWFGANRFTSYDSFVHVRDRHLRTKKLKQM